MAGVSGGDTKRPDYELVLSYVLAGEGGDGEGRPCICLLREWEWVECRDVYRFGDGFKIVHTPSPLSFGKVANDRRWDYRMAREFIQRKRYSIDVPDWARFALEVGPVFPTYADV